jgi:hypothetical protein
MNATIERTFQWSPHQILISPLESFIKVKGEWEGRDLIEFLWHAYSFIRSIWRWNKTLLTRISGICTEQKEWSRREQSCILAAQCRQVESVPSLARRLAVRFENTSTIHRTCPSFLHLGTGVRFFQNEATSMNTHNTVRECIQKFPNWPSRARTENGTALCH